MKYMGLNEIRETFLSFFEEKAHKRLGSFPLVPKDDKSLLLINSGMAPMKKWFLGQETPPNSRVATCQKCIRTPDIDRVGKTDRHGTFFEMLGNFSFGDYFKEEATSWAWEFVTQVLEMPIDKLYITIYQDDEETFDIWTKRRGVDPSKIVRLGKEDNFWEIGTGPCGPCSEIYFDRGEKYGCDNPNCAPGCECDRFVEFWNLVFSQYNSDGKGNYTPMEHPNIDTGMGLERLACILQGVDNLFEVDTVKKIMDKACELTGFTYKQSEKVDVALRVITDHIRSSVFMISDGIIPSNEGRGYVLRRIIRRAYRYGAQIGVQEGKFLYSLVPTVVEENKAAYPELAENEDYIIKILEAEETSFISILDRGTERLNQVIDKMDKDMESVIPGDEVFRLCDTYGFPFEIIQSIVSERDFSIDEKEFYRLMDDQKNRARQAAASETIAWSESDIQVDVHKTDFIGYDCFECEAKLLYISDNDGEKEQLCEDESAYLIFDRTPFYPNGGGQVADKGVFSVGDTVLNITDCKKLSSGHYIHLATVMTGCVKKGVNGHLKIDILRRKATSRNHTAAHLLQKALRDILGDHVHQSGQLVDGDHLRFDFNHFEGLTNEELRKVEKRVNEVILAALPVSVTETDIETAKKKGAMALFGEKYGEVVRVVDAGGYSIELCGGTHVNNTSEIGLFKINSESSIAAGIRRIEAITGASIIKMIYGLENVISKSASALKLQNMSELPEKVRSISNELKEANKKVEEMNIKLTTNNMADIFKDSTKNVSGIRVMSATLNGVDSKALRALGDQVKANNDDIVAAIASINDGKGSILVVSGSKAIERGANAGQIVKELSALAGGKGGGRADSAMAGVSRIFELDEALTQLSSIVQKNIENADANRESI